MELRLDLGTTIGLDNYKDLVPVLYLGQSEGLPGKIQEATFEV